jgi:hypothetical protein
MGFSKTQKRDLKAQERRTFGSQKGFRLPFKKNISPKHLKTPFFGAKILLLSTEIAAIEFFFVTLPHHSDKA